MIVTDFLLMVTGCTEFADEYLRNRTATTRCSLIDGIAPISITMTEWIHEHRIALWSNGIIRFSNVLYAAAARIGSVV